MFESFRKRRIEKLTKKVSDYVSRNYYEPRKIPESMVVFSRDFDAPSRKDHVEFYLNLDEDNKGNKQYNIDIFSENDKKSEVKDSKSDNKKTDTKESQDNKTEKSNIEASDAENDNISDIDSEKFPGNPADSYDPEKFLRLMTNYSKTKNSNLLLEKLKSNIDRTFVQRVKYWIGVNHLDYPTVYKAAQIDRRLFSKMMSDDDYKPSKDTAIAVCFGLRLRIWNATDLLQRAGYTLSHSDKRDVIIEYFLKVKKYNLDDVNAVLYELGQKTIGR